MGTQCHLPLIDFLNPYYPGLAWERNVPTVQPVAKNSKSFALKKHPLTPNGKRIEQLRTHPMCRYTGRKFSKIFR